MIKPLTSRHAGSMSTQDCSVSRVDAFDSQVSDATVLQEAYSVFEAECPYSVRTRLHLTYVKMRQPEVQHLSLLGMSGPPIR